MYILTFSTVSLSQCIPTLVLLLELFLHFEENQFCSLRPRTNYFNLPVCWQGQIYQYCSCFQTNLFFKSFFFQGYDILSSSAHVGDLQTTILVFSLHEEVTADSQNKNINFSKYWSLFCVFSCRIYVFLEENK